MMGQSEGKEAPDKKELELYQGNGKWELEPGEFEFMVGSSSESLPLKATISL